MRSRKTRKAKKTTGTVWWQNDKFLKSVLKFTAIIALFGFLLAAFFQLKEGVMDDRILVAQQTNAVLNAFGINTSQLGHTIFLTTSLGEGIIIDIIPECVGWIGMFAIAALIFAYPRASMKNRLVGLAIFVPLMYLVNIVRLVITVAAGYYGSADNLFFMHSFLWRVLLIVAALGFWVIWIKYIARKARK
ncbi:MAG: exosortase/archaeosortase family protein [Candidatus Micrarchaeota archaeon]